MSCGATGCNARGAPRVGVPRRDESVATGDGALCDASTGPATRTAQRVGRGRVGRCALPQEHPAAGQHAKPHCKPPIVTRECARLARSESRARVRVARNDLGAHGPQKRARREQAGWCIATRSTMRRVPMHSRSHPGRDPRCGAAQAQSTPHPSPHAPLSAVQPLVCIAAGMLLRQLRRRSRMQEGQARHQSDVAALRPTPRPTHTTPEARAQLVRVRRQLTMKTDTLKTDRVGGPVGGRTGDPGRGGRWDGREWGGWDREGW